MGEEFEFRVLVSAPYMLPVIEEFRSQFEASGIELVLAEVRERLSSSELMPFAGTIDGVIGGDDEFSRAVLGAFSPRLKVISKWGTGIDSIDQAAAKEFGVLICNTPGAFTDPVSDSVLQFMLMFARMGPWQDRELKSGRWQKLPSRALSECTLGVIGVGTIGKAVLRRARAFGMRLLGNDIIEISPDFIAEVGVKMLPLEDLLAFSDFVSINCDLNPTSLGLLDAQTLAMVKPGCVLINTARGKIVDQNALIEALQAGKLAGAALDVFEQEPIEPGSPLLGMDNVLLTPHNANSSPTAWGRVHVNTVRNLFEGLGLEYQGEV